MHRAFGLCGVFYVRVTQGFIDGAVASDERVTNNIGDRGNTQRIAEQPLARDFVYANRRLQFSSVVPEEK